MMSRKTKEPVRLGKVEEPRQIDLSSIENHIITIAIILGLILLALLFLIICCMLIPKTYGFFWY